MAQSWQNTITIELNGQAHAYTRIQSTKEAAHYLLDHWPGRRTPAYCAAIRSCTKALKGEMSDAAAYLLFITAVQEAQVALVMGRRLINADPFEQDMQQVLAESVLEDLHATPFNNSHL